MTTAWTASSVRRIDPAAVSRVPPIEPRAHGGLDRARVYWDMWPVQAQDGSVARIAGRELWMALSAPDRGDPALRHFEATIRLLERRGGGWHDLGDVLPRRPVDYEREWAGSAVHDGDGITLYYTAAGTAERAGGYQQRLVESHALVGGDGLPEGWTAPQVSLVPDERFYMPAATHDGAPGEIEAFRDPAYFCDPADGAEYLIFTASRADPDTAFNGVVGAARREGGQWHPLPPIVQADGVNNELERAHAVFHVGRYYVFWVTQRETFAPGLRDAPTGLYGMVADSLLGEYRPLNGTGLVLANPPDDPRLAYSWFVSRELVVSSFVDFRGLGVRGVPGDPAEARRFFGGVPAPLLQLAIDGDTCRLAGEATV